MECLDGGGDGIFFTSEQRKNITAILVNIILQELQIEALQITVVLKMYVYCFYDVKK